MASRWSQARGTILKGSISEVSEKYGGQVVNAIIVSALGQPAPREVSLEIVKWWLPMLPQAQSRRTMQA